MDFGRGLGQTKESVNMSFAGFGGGQAGGAVGKIGGSGGQTNVADGQNRSIGGQFGDAGGRFSVNGGSGGKQLDRVELLRGREVFTLLVLEDIRPLISQPRAPKVVRGRFGDGNFRGRGRGRFGGGNNPKVNTGSAVVASDLICFRWKEKGHGVANCKTNLVCDICEGSDHLANKCPLLLLP